MEEIIIGKLRHKNNKAQYLTDEATSNLLSFFELLIEIDREHGITSPKQREGQP